MTFSGDIFPPKVLMETLETGSGQAFKKCQKKYKNVIFVPDLGDHFGYNRLSFWAGRWPLTFFPRKFYFTKIYFPGLSINVNASEVAQKYIKSDFSLFWHPFGARFGTENAHKILFWLTLETFVNTKATKVCGFNFNAILKHLFYEKVTQSPPAGYSKKG